MGLTGRLARLITYTPGHGVLIFEIYCFCGARTRPLTLFSLPSIRELLVNKSPVEIRTDHESEEKKRKKK